VIGRRHRLFWICAAVLLVAIGGLLVAHALTFNPKDVQDELEKKLAEFRGIPEDDVLKRDVLLHELRDNQSYRDHAKALYREVERLHAKVHGPAELELEAKKAVLPFLARCRELSRLPAEEIRLLYDESRSHLVNYGATRQGPPLRDVHGRLKELLEKQDRIDPKEFIQLQKDVLKACDAGKFSDASALIGPFRKRPGSVDYEPKIRELEAMVARKAAMAVKPR
jgi:hypothetical protein